MIVPVLGTVSGCPEQGQDEVGGESVRKKLETLGLQRQASNRVWQFRLYASSVGDGSTCYSLQAWRLFYKHKCLKMAN